MIMSTSENIGLAGKDGSIETLCGNLRNNLKVNGIKTKDLLLHRVFDSEQGYIGQHGEMKANIMLAYRHLEDARMRIGKVLQAAGDGVSILDK
jgi:hypothetical protein